MRGRAGEQRSAAAGGRLGLGFRKSSETGRAMVRQSPWLRPFSPRTNEGHAPSVALLHRLYIRMTERNMKLNHRLSASFLCSLAVLMGSEWTSAHGFGRFGVFGRFGRPPRAMAPPMARTAPMAPMARTAAKAPRAIAPKPAAAKPTLAPRYTPSSRARLQGLGRRISAKRGIGGRGGRGIQDHHIVPKQHASHPFVKRSGLSMGSRKNMVLLPKSPKTKPMDFKPKGRSLAKSKFPAGKARSNHNGWNRTHKQYNATTKKQLDGMERIANKRGWSPQKRHASMDRYLKARRGALKSGKVKVGP